ncbi:hypothetical protein D8674_006137 [Pyrus ussuriensis x Pyrus communis]|uniref:DUF4283 domain-containing protein n=1 Tax=Pyrus ussuriensis x Pyrus communis TaxID=2448454 RepID=A0A5N5FYE1_9ROSA|nr:hypothetical protein D8674_006137 [Pyrus ussuriensis x Pyrus communis]
MEELGQSLGEKLHLTDKEKDRVVIDKKNVDEAPIVFIDRFMSLWRGIEGVSICDIGDRRFLVRFVTKRDMQRVLDSEFP